MVFYRIRVYCFTVAFIYWSITLLRATDRSFTLFCQRLRWLRLVLMFKFWSFLFSCKSILSRIIHEHARTIVFIRDLQKLWFRMSESVIRILDEYWDVSRFRSSVLKNYLSTDHSNTYGMRQIQQYSNIWIMFEILIKTNANPKTTGSSLTVCIRTLGLNLITYHHIRTLGPSRRPKLRPKRLTPNQCIRIRMLWCISRVIYVFAVACVPCIRICYVVLKTLIDWISSSWVPVWSQVTTEFNTSKISDLEFRFFPMIQKLV